MFWFHCGRCGSLFQSQPGDSDERLCPKCGLDPSPGIQPAARDAIPAAAPGSPESAEDSASPARAKQKVKRRKNRHLMLKIFGGWLVLLIIIFVTVRNLYHDESSEKAAASEPVGDRPEDLNPDDDFIQKHAQACATTFSGFIAQTAPEQCSEFVLTPTGTVGRMARFQTYNSLPKLEPESLRVESQTLLHFADGNGIELRWTTKDGMRFETLFREAREEWKLDWEHFARFSDYSWSLFLAGSGPDECEFRLLARERLVEERKDKDKTISVVFYSPKFGQPLETGFQSPEFLVPRDTPAGRALEAGFRDAAAGKQPFGSKLPSPNPDGIIRVRVKVKRIETNGERRFEVTDVPACHWYSSNEPGTDPSASSPADPPAGGQ